MKNKLYYIQYNVGKAKYVVNYYDGKKEHKDGSDFYDISLFRNKKKMNDFVKNLLLQNYKQK